MQDALFHAVLDAPDDMTVRLIYADWCEERGEPRAEFIRTQLQLSGALGETPSRAEAAQLRAREQQLLQRHRRYWNGPLHRFLMGTPLRHQIGRMRAIRGWSYARGFVEDLRVEAFEFVCHTDLLFQLGPLRRVHLLGAERFVDDVADSPRFRTLEQVTMVFRAPPQRASLQALMRICRKENSPQVSLCGPLGIDSPSDWARLLREVRVTMLGYQPPAQRRSR